MAVNLLIILHAFLMFILTSLFVVPILKTSFHTLYSDNLSINDTIKTKIQALTSEFGTHLILLEKKYKRE